MIKNDDKKPLIALIVAFDEQQLIGSNNELPWHLPADLKHFKQTTFGKTVIMGRKTHQSIGKALPDRRNIVISHQTDLNLVGVEVAPNLAAALECCASEDEVMVIGGMSIYEQALPMASRLYLTQIHHIFAGDAHFPDWQQLNWHIKKSERFVADDKNIYDYTFSLWERKL